MTKVAMPTDKCLLKSLHREIDLYDRKLVYLDKHVDFANPADREEAKHRLLHKRSSVERNARELAAAGVEFCDADLPRSFRIANPGASDRP